MQLFDLPMIEAKRVLKTGAPVFLTVNPVEYHGPHLSLHNDRLLSEGLCERVHQALVVDHPEWPLIMASDLEIGVDPCQGTGSRHTAFADMQNSVLAACASLADMGAQRVVLMTFHGAPMHNMALQAGVEFLQQRGIHAIAPFSLVLRELLHIEPREFSAAVAHVPEPDRSRLLDGLPHDFHAGFFETSVALALAPHSVSPVHKNLPPCAEVEPHRTYVVVAQLAERLGNTELCQELKIGAVGIGWAALRPFPGYTSMPSYATAEAGVVFVEHIMNLYMPVVRKAMAGQVHEIRPIMRWVSALTLGGRVGSGGGLRTDELLNIDA